MQNISAIFSNNNVVVTQHASASTTKFFCVQQAKQQTIANSKNYSAQQLAFANSILTQASNAFLRSKCYLNVRKTCVSIKVANVQKACLASNAVAQFSAYIAQHKNISVKQTQNALIFNITF